MLPHGLSHFRNQEVKANTYSKILVPRGGLEPSSLYPLIRKCFFASSIENVYQPCIPMASAKPKLAFWYFPSVDRHAGSCAS